MKYSMQYSKSDLNNCGSLKNIKSGLASTARVLRLKRFFFSPSTFHVKEVNTTGYLETDLSFDMSNLEVPRGSLLLKLGKYILV